MSMESPLNEILAIMLFEHDTEPSPNGIRPKRRSNRLGWSMINEDCRQRYRDMASGKSPLYDYTKNEASK